MNDDNASYGPRADTHIAGNRAISGCRDAEIAENNGNNIFVVFISAPRRNSLGNREHTDWLTAAARWARQLQPTVTHGALTWKTASGAVRRAVLPPVLWPKFICFLLWSHFCVRFRPVVGTYDRRPRWYRHCCPSDRRFTPQNYFRWTGAHPTGRYRRRATTAATVRRARQ